MNTLKKCDANNRQCASRNWGFHSFRPAEQQGRADSSEIKPDGQWAGKLTFAEDFTQEHCLPGLHLASIEISGNF